MSIYVGYFVFVFIYSLWNILHFIIVHPFPQKGHQLSNVTQFIGESDERESKEKSKSPSEFRHQRRKSVDQFKVVLP